MDGMEGIEDSSQIQEMRIERVKITLPERRKREAPSRAASIRRTVIYRPDLRLGQASERPDGATDALSRSQRN